MDRRGLAKLGILTSLLVAVLACGGSGSGGGGGGGGGAGDITITAQLVTGQVTSSALVASSDRSRAAVLVSYKLYCVTFASPPAAASGVADANGNVSVTLAAQGVAFGCFVRDANDNTVATLNFQSGGTTGTTLTLGGSANLGAVTVDTTTGLASAAPSTGTVASTPSGATCPTGYWIVNTGSGSCGATTARVWVVPSPAGGYLVTIIHGPDTFPGTNNCGYYQAFNNLPATYANGVLSVGPFRSNPGDVCANNLTLAITPQNSCTTVSAAGTFTGCGICDSPSGGICGGGGGGGNGVCGNLTCQATWQGTKQ